MYRSLSKVNIPKKNKNKPKALTKSSKEEEIKFEEEVKENEEVRELHDKNLKLNFELKRSQQREIEKTINRIDALIHPENKQPIKRIPRIILKKPIKSTV